MKRLRRLFCRHKQYKKIYEHINTEEIDEYKWTIIEYFPWYSLWKKKYSKRGEVYYIVDYKKSVVYWYCPIPKAKILH